MNNRLAECCTRATLGLYLTLLTVTVVLSDQTALGNNSKVVLEVLVSGKGMVWPTMNAQVFFRLFEDGRVEYESRTKNRVVRKKAKLKRQEFAEIIQLAETSDFINSSERFRALQTLGDASLTTTIAYRHKDIIKRIEIINYQQANPEARSFYPLAVMKLLDKVIERRPKSDYEKKYGLDTPGIPYDPSGTR